MGFFGGGAKEGWRSAGRRLSGLFTLPAMDPTAVWPLPDDSEYYFYVRVWLSNKHFKIFRSDGVAVRSRGPQLKVAPRVLDGQLERNADFWSGIVEAPTNVSVHPFVDKEYQVADNAIGTTWAWVSVKGWAGLFTADEVVRLSRFLCASQC
jgi:hypothetical protein